VGSDGATAFVDTGFIVHDERTYPNLLRLFAELGVATQESDVSMSVRCDGCGLEYADTRHPDYFGDAAVWWGLTVLGLHHPVGLVGRRPARRS
jgi:hypothetical protein